eukprot:9780-Heterococcus_DN1.PRE.1
MAPQARTDSPDVIDPLDFLKPIGLTQYSTSSRESSTNTVHAASNNDLSLICTAYKCDRAIDRTTGNA